MNKEELRLKDPNIFPTEEVLKDALGQSYGAYTTFLDGLGKLDLEQIWQFYPCVCGKAWMARGCYKWTTLRGANKEKNIYWLSAWDGYFNVAIWFKEINRVEILKANISEETKEFIRSAKMLGQKMKTFPVEFAIDATESLADIYELIKLKKRLEA